MWSHDVRSAARALIVLLLAGWVSTTVASGEIPPDKRVSGYDQMSAAVRAMQDDDTANPATFWVLDGQALWTAKTGTADKSCADCHQDARESMRGVAARHPAFDAASQAAVNLEGRINLCRTVRQGAGPLAYESKELLALTSFVAHQSRSTPIATPAPELSPVIAAGRAFFMLRQGQLNLSCAQCHDDNWGRKLAGSTIPQGHPNGYPLYRLEWQTVGSLHRRLRNCLTGMRAENLPAGSAELIALEAYLMQRAEGLLIESPAVRP